MTAEKNNLHILLDKPVISYANAVYSRFPPVPYSFFSSR